MRRRTFDALMTAAGLILTVVLTSAGCLMLWANHFVDHQVSTQLSAQQIYFPTKAQRRAERPGRRARTSASTPASS